MLFQLLLLVVWIALIGEITAGQVIGLIVGILSICAFLIGFAAAVHRHFSKDIEMLKKRTHSLKSMVHAVLMYADASPEAKARMNITEILRNAEKDARDW